MNGSVRVFCSSNLESTVTITTDGAFEVRTLLIERCARRKTATRREEREAGGKLLSRIFSPPPPFLKSLTTSSSLEKNVPAPPPPFCRSLSSSRVSVSDKVRVVVCFARRV